MRLDGVSIEQYHMSLTERPTIPTAEQEVEHIQVRGRHGSLTKKYALNDVPFKLEFNYLESEVPFASAYRTFKLALFRAQTLDFEDDLGVYRKIKSVSLDDANNDDLYYGSFPASFTLDPFSYSSDPAITTVTGQTVLSNPGYESEPYIKVYLNGSGHIYFGDQTVALINIGSFIEIDCAMKNAYLTTETGLLQNMNSHMVGDFPVIGEGQQTVNIDGDITKLEILPRWRWR
jgi:phage-related protein